MENNENQNRLEEENRLLREQLEEIRAKLQRSKAARNRVILLLLRAFSGRPLYSSVNQLVDELSERRLERETIKKVTYATLHRLTRVGVVMLMVALGPLILAGLQTYYLKKQNDKLDIQNKRIEQQTYLQEAERRSSLVFLFDNIMNKIDEELRRSPSRRDLSPQLIGRIVALTKALKPYRFLEGDTITSEMSSPERGQVLLSLLASKLSRNTCDQIFLLADFSYTTLQNVNLDGVYLGNINLSNAILESVSLTGADLSRANFQGAELRRLRVLATGVDARPARFDGANFHKARLSDCDLSSSSFEFTNFSDATLRRVSFRRAFFNQAKFAQIEAENLDFGEATLLNTALSLSAAETAPKPSFQWTGMQVDSLTYQQIRSLPFSPLPVLDRSQRRVQITRDTFYIDDRESVIVEDSVEVFGTLPGGEK